MLNPADYEDCIDAILDAMASGDKYARTGWDRDALRDERARLIVEAHQAGAPVREIAAAARCHPSTVRRIARHGGLPRWSS